MRNIAAHRVDAQGVFTSGGDVGFVAIVIASAIPVLLAPLMVDGIDVWTLFKSLSTVLLGDDAMAHPTGFELAPVLVGAGVHLFLGAAVGALFALVVSLVDIDGIAPTVVIMITLFGAYSFLLVWLPLSESLMPALAQIPSPFIIEMIMTYAIVLGLGVARWRRRWDGTECVHGASERAGWLLVAHEWALVATVLTLIMIVVGAAMWGVTSIHWWVAAPYLVLHAAAAWFAASHALQDRRDLAAATSRRMP